MTMSQCATDGQSSCMHVALRCRRQFSCERPDPARPVELLHRPQTFLSLRERGGDLTRRYEITLPSREFSRCVDNDFAVGIAPLPPLLVVTGTS